MAHYLKTPFLLALVFLANASAVLGQNIFQKRSDLNYRFTEFTSVHPSDTGFFVLGWAIPLIPIDSINGVLGNRRILMTWYNWDGTINKHEYFMVDSANYYGMWYSNHTLGENGFYHYGQLIDANTTISPNTSDVALIKFSLEGDTIWTKRYNSGYFDVATCGLITNNGDFVAVGYCNTGTNMFQRIIRFSNTGNIIWNKTYNSSYESFARYIIGDDEGNFFIGGFTRPQGGGNPKNARTRVMKIDSLGDIIWNKSIFGICDEFSSSLALASDGNLLVAKGKCKEQPTFQGTDNKLSLYKLNKNTGDTLWHKEYEPELLDLNDALFVQQLNDGNIILGGNSLKLFFNNQGDTIFGKQTGVLIKTDSMGNQLWMRHYFYNEGDSIGVAYNYLTDGKPTSDGGYILVGHTISNTWNDGWIIKTDANGCIDLSCVNGIEELDDEDFRLSIYPNPAEEYVSIDLPIQYNKGTLQVYTMQGQLVKTASITTSGTQSFSIADMPNGIYQLVVYSNTNKLLGREKLVVGR